MAFFMVERHLPGITTDQLQAAGLRARTCAAQVTDEGTQVRWMRSVFMPETGQCFCMFEAPTREVVAEANERARIPFQAIREVLELRPEAL